MKKGCIILLIMGISVLCQAREKNSTISVEELLQTTLPGYAIPQMPKKGELGGPYTVYGDFNRDGVEDIVLLAVDPEKKWALGIANLRKRGTHVIHQDKNFSREMGLGLFSARDFKEWKTNRAKDDPLLYEASGIKLEKAIELDYGETSAQVFYWDGKRFKNFWIAD